MDYYHSIHGSTKLPATLNNYCLLLHGKLLQLALRHLLIYRSMVGLTSCSVDSHFVTYFISYSWGNTNYCFYLLICITFWIHCYCYCWSSLRITINQLMCSLFVMYRSTVLGVGSHVKYSMRQSRVLYLSLDSTPCTVFFIHHLQRCFNIYLQLKYITAYRIYPNRSLRVYFL